MRAAHDRPAAGAGAIPACECRGAAAAARSRHDHVATSDERGTGYARVLEWARSDPALAARICPTLPYRWAELPHAVSSEMALSVCDFMIRRTHIICEDPNQGLDQAPEVASRMGAILGWGAEEQARQLAEYRHQVDLTRKWKSG